MIIAVPITILNVITLTMVMIARVTMVVLTRVLHTYDNGKCNDDSNHADSNDSNSNGANDRDDDKNYTSSTNANIVNGHIQKMIIATVVTITSLD